jgi:type IV pilus assembly protein PilE
LRNYRWSESYNRLSARNGIASKYMQQRLKGMDMKRKQNSKGFTLVELMIVVGIVAILVALALPSYTRYVRKANRGEAQQILLNWSNNQEIWRANDTDYAGVGDITPPTHDKYNFTVASDTNTYTLTATATTPDQLKDSERGNPCSPLALNQANEKTPDDCW